MQAATLPKFVAKGQSLSASACRAGSRSLQGIHRDLKTKQNKKCVSKVLYISSIGEKGTANVERSEGLARPASCPSLASPGFCKVFPALRFPGPGCLVSAAQRWWRRLSGAGDLISSIGPQTPFSPSGRAPWRLQ